MKRILVVFLILNIGCNTQTTYNDDRIFQEIDRLTTDAEKRIFLENIMRDDQGVRNGEKEAALMLQYGVDSKEHMTYIEEQWKQDEINLAKIEYYLQKFSYPSKSLLGSNAAYAPWAVIHHSTDVDARNRNFSILHEAYKNNDIDDSAMSLYLGRTYEFIHRKRFEMQRPYTAEDEINQLIEELDLLPD